VPVIESNPGVLGGVACFAGTRIPVESLFDHLRKGYSIDEYLEQFPTVTREQVQAVLDMARERIPFDAPRAAG
jgi:uncharacterized protein (DUF433 family)